MSHKYLFILFMLPCVTFASKSDFVRTDQVLSQELLSIVGTTTVEITERVRIKIKECVNPVAFPIKVLGLARNVHMIRVAIETENHKNPKLLITLKDEGGLHQWNPLLSTSINIKEYNGKRSNLWVLYYTDSNVYANSVPVICNVIFDSFE